MISMILILILIARYLPGETVRERGREGEIEKKRKEEKLRRCLRKVIRYLPA